MKYFAIVSLLIMTARAASSTTNPLIPSGISQTCSTFLSDLDTDSALSNCTTPIVSATSSYGPNGNATTTSSAAITSSLNALCSSTVSNACSTTMLSAKLAAFAQECQSELVANPVMAVRTLYDVLYMMYPFRTAVCCKGDNGQYCAIQSTASSGASNTSSLGNSDIQKYLWSTASTLSRRDSAITIPNATTIEVHNIAFLLLQANLPASSLCTTCTRSIITSYINYESNVPYGLGLSQSTMFGGQTVLYNAIQSTCGASFLSGAVQAAGGISGGILSGAPRTVGVDFRGMMVVMLGVVGLGFTAGL